MSYSVKLTTDLVRVEPGSTAHVDLDVINGLEGQDRFEIEVEGIDPAWVAIPVPNFVSEVGETRREKLFLKPPREAESLAGTYPFVVNVRSLESGAVKSVQGALEVTSFKNFSVDVLPRRAVVSATNKTAEFKVTVMNLGNGELTLQLFAADPDNAFAYDLDIDQLTVAAGQQKSVTLSVMPTKRSMFANARLQNFSVTAQALQNASTAARATGQIEQRALLTPGTLLMALLVVGLVLGWAALYPKPPRLDSLEVTPESTMVGQPVKVEWRTTGATSVKLTIGNWSKERLVRDGSVTYVPDKPGRFAVEMTVINGDQQIKDMSHVITVGTPIRVPPPVIRSLSIESNQVKVGTSFMMSYQFGDSVVRAVLYPMQRELDVKEKGILLTVDEPGRVRYTVKAFNSTGEVTEQSVSFMAVKPSRAKIVAFSANTQELEPEGGTVAFDFTVNDAVKIKLVYNGQEVDVKNPQSTSAQEVGHHEISLTSETTFKLVAYDSDGVAVTSQPITIKVKKPPENQDAPPDPGSTGSNPTTGGTGQ